MIDFYTAPTPNGHKVSCVLEAMELAYETHIINLSKNEQKEPDFLAVSPNGDTACTLSRQEDAFRIWSKKTTYSQTGVASVMWKCLYKVKTPAGKPQK